MTNTVQMAEEFVALVPRFVRLRPKLVFPDERVAALKQQLHSLKASSAANPEERMFLFRILLALASREEPPTMGELSAELGIPLSSATRMADGLVRSKFAERRADSSDRRVVHLCMTERGRRFIEMGTSYMKQRIARLLRHFTAGEQAELLRLLNKLIDSLQAEEQHDATI